MLDVCTTGLGFKLRRCRPDNSITAGVNPGQSDDGREAHWEGRNGILNPLHSQVSYWTIVDFVRN